MAKIKDNDVVSLKKTDIFANSTLPFPIYFSVANQYVLYKPAGSVFNEKDFARLKENNIETVYITKDSEYKYASYFGSCVAKLVSDTKTPLEQKSFYLMKNASYVIRDIFDDPVNPQTFIKSQALVKSFVDFLGHGISAFHSIISLSMHDFYTYTHSIGVMTYSIALASQLGISAKQTLEDIGLSGLLHDIGKSKVPAKIINKPGKLNEEEWTIMRKHPVWSHEIATTYKGLPDVALIAIRQHHENPAGTGYPDGIKGTELHMFSKIVAIADVYSAIATDRAYAKGKPCFEALKIMKSIAENGQLDKNIFNNLVLMLKG
jgi:putative nucleotidyltransferase with HDIG domain